MHNVFRHLLGAAVVVSVAIATGPALAQETFADPDAAVAAVLQALEARDREALLAVFGADAADVIFTGEEAQDVEAWGSFLRSYNEMHRIAEQTDGTATLYLGPDQWPFPIPLIQADGGWQFDAAAGRDEIFFRRIGQNELDVIALMKGYVRAQAAFRQTDYDDDGVMEFARSIISDEGRRDGLYWPPEPGAPESPIGDFMAEAAADGYSVDGVDAEPEPYLGYYYRVLREQTEAAPGGAMSYLVNDNMVAGHALLAIPASYGETGVMTFIVNENGLVLEADLGEDTLDIAAEMLAYDPNDDWLAAEED